MLRMEFYFQERSITGVPLAKSLIALQLFYVLSKITSVHSVVKAEAICACACSESYAVLLFEKEKSIHSFL